MQEGTQKADIIKTLNDSFRQTLVGGKILLTRGVADLGDTATQKIISLVQNYNEFTEDNDPYGEHDFGVFHYENHKLFWKIDYYDSDGVHGSEDPSNTEKTLRILTVMLASEY